MPLRCPWGPLAGCRDPWTVPCGDRSAVTCGFEEDLQATVPDAVSPRGVERGGPRRTGGCGEAGACPEWPEKGETQDGLHPDHLGPQWCSGGAGDY
ncbi:Hypothetical predicted protein [Pelobates cultripes]|uniref:Uncharacterized protein n=1 Tax=Pelobates cultripes TaxID=61616 RepID=A0AAD1W954_PELCU|nr:Hypothetical predicted protein [Pelobates cultripes]